MNLPKISALDLRSLEVIVAEHNARGGLQHGIWYPEEFKRSCEGQRFAVVRGG